MVFTSLRRARYRFWFQEETPTYFNLAKYLQTLGWQRTQFRWRSQFNSTHLVFDSVVSEQLEFKHRLLQLVNQFCPSVMPRSFEIDDYNANMVLQQLRDSEKQEVIWILKPSFLNNGQHIHFFTTLAQLSNYYAQTDRVGGKHVLQEYLASPWLLRGHKFSIRVFVVLTNQLDAYIYPQGYYNVAQEPYPGNDFSSLQPHLTNEHLCEDKNNVIQIPTSHFADFTEYYSQIKRILGLVMHGLTHLHGSTIFVNRSPRLAIFGFDFMVDSNKKVWLLEANHGPCFPMTEDHPLQKYVYEQFWHHFISGFVIPIAGKQELRPETASEFELIYNS